MVVKDTGKVITTPAAALSWMKANNPKPAVLARATSSTSSSSSIRTSKDAITTTAPGAISTQSPKPQSSTPVLSTSRPTSGWSNVWDTFTAPWKGIPVYVRGTNNNPVIGAITSGAVAVAEVGSLAYLSAQAVSSAIAAKSTTTAASIAPAAVTGSSTSLRTALYAGGAGAIAGYILSDTGNQAQNLQPVQNTNPYIQPSQTAAQDTTARIDTTQNPGDIGISNSPGASIRSDRYSYSIPTSYQYPSQAPMQYTPSEFTPSQSTSAEQSKGSDLLIPALIVGAALVLMKN